ncbi:MAG: hypothetical protein HKN01_03715, partial [Acidimicrobiia bacterium]|nr:hypothetical protein [Acidimicrobiia bacterium]
MAAGLLVLGLVASACGTSDSSDTTTITNPVSTTTSSAVGTSAATTSTASTTIPGNPRYAGIVRLGIDADFVFPMEDFDGTRRQPSLNPILAWPGSPEMARLFIPGAYRIDAGSGQLVPWLVEEIPTLANGGVTIDADGAVSVTYRVREEAVWEDDTPIVADDLAFTHQLLTSDELPITGRSSIREVHSLIEAGSIETSGKTFTAR